MIPSRRNTYHAALAGSHEAYSRVEVWRSGVQVEELTFRRRGSPDLARNTPVFLGGSVRASLQSRVARTLDLTVPEWLYPFKSNGLLNPYGTQLRAFRGIRYGDGGIDEFPVFVGRIRSVKPAGGGTAKVSAADLAQTVIAAGFSAPSRAQVGANVYEEFRRLVSEAVPGATFGPSPTFTEVVPELSYDLDRGAAIDGIAKAAGAFWYPLAGGDFVLRRIPWTVNLTSMPLPLQDGVGGTVLSAYPERSADDVYSRITCTVERTDGSDPVSATADDLDPASPTYILGPFGVKAGRVQLNQAASPSSALAAARTVLARSRALTEAWQVTCVPDPSMELGDPFDLAYKGGMPEPARAVQLVAGYALPLDPDGTMSIDGRALQSTELPP
jgi:hypothetical protein